MSMAHRAGFNGRTMVEITLPRSALRRNPRSRRRRADPAAALGASLAAGSVFLTLMVALSVGLYDEPAWKIPQMIAATLRAGGPARGFDPAWTLLGVAMHFALAALYALAFAGITAELRSRYTATLGVAFGGALYFVNLHGFTHLFPWFAELRTTDTLLAHALFGLMLARFHHELSE